ncbi:MAG: ankyrin repeat domain-containing protein [Holosporaceae bacterium]|nr:ankyrin repeat domain-containing protein [Holosporaceae bacterium]
MRNIYVISLMLVLICFSSKANEKEAVQISRIEDSPSTSAQKTPNVADLLKRTTSSVDLGDFYEEGEHVESISEKLRKFKQKNPEGEISLHSISVPDELSLVNNLYNVVQKIGYGERKKEEKTYYVIDISYPAIKRFAESLVKKESAKSRGYFVLKDILDKYGEISHVAADKTKTNILDGQLNDFVELAVSFFDLSEMEDPADQNKVKEWIKTIAVNYSGFQRIMLVMITMCLDYAEGFVIESPLKIAENLLKIKVKKTKGKFSYFSYGDGTMRLTEHFFEKSRRAPYREEGAAALFHEVGHAIHCHIFGECFYSQAIPFFINSISSSDALIDKFFPMLVKDNLDAKKNAVLKRIEDAVQEEGISKKFSDAITGGKKIEELDWKLRTILKIFYTIINDGFGSIAFGNDWENKTVTEILTTQNIARILYMRALVFSPFEDKYWKEEDPDSQSIDELKNKWLDPEEILTIFGIVPLNFKDKLIVLEDRQNDQIFNLRNKQGGEIKKVYRTHALTQSSEEMNRLLSSFFYKKGIIFFNDNTERDRLVFPSNPVYSEGDVSPSTLFFENSENNPLKELMFDKIRNSIAQREGTGIVKNFLDNITVEEINEREAAPGETLMSIAVKAENWVIVDFLFSKGVNLTIENLNKESLLFAAVGNLPLAKLLLDNGADSNIKDSEGRTPLHFVAQKIKDDAAAISDLLLAKGAKIDDEDNLKNTPLHYASRFGNVKMVLNLLSKGAKADVKNSKRETPLHLVVESIRGADADAIVDLLLDKGAKIDSEDDLKNTPLHCAAKYANVRMISIFLSKGGGPDVKNSKGETPLHLVAKSHGSSSIKAAELLLDNGAELESTDNSENTPLHCATQRAKGRMVKFLLFRGAKPDVKNSSPKKTPLAYHLSHLTERFISSLREAARRGNPDFKFA